MQISNDPFDMLKRHSSKYYDCVSYDEMIQNLIKFYYENKENTLLS